MLNDSMCSIACKLLVVLFVKDEVGIDALPIFDDLCERLVVRVCDTGVPDISPKTTERAVIIFICYIPTCSMQFAGHSAMTPINCDRLL